MTARTLALAELGRGCAGMLGNLISPIFGSPKQVGLPSLMPTSTMTVTAGTVIINSVTGPQSLMGGAGSILGTNPATGQPVQGAGSGILGFGLGGAQSQGAQQAGSGLLAFGFGDYGLRTAGLTGNMARYAKAIQSLESGGNYSILGPVTKTGDRAYGAYQMMGNNIPEWTRQTFGRSMSPQELLGDKAAQDAVFSKIFGGYVEKFGPSGAAQAWFGGPGSVGRLDRRDMLGTSVGEYGAKFNRALGLQPRADAGPINFDDAAKSFSQSTDQASQSLTSLADATAQLPAGADAATSSLTGLLNSLFSAKGGGGGIFASLFGGGDVGETVTFAQGGYTGSGGRYQPAGIVHAGEYVFSAHSVDRIGVQRLEALHRGYADGGLVTPMAPQPVPMPPLHAMTPAAAANSNSPVMPVTFGDTFITPANGVTPESLRAVLVQERQETIKHIARNFGAIGAESQRRFG